MPLAELQSALGALVSAGHTSRELQEWFAPLNLTETERDWLGSLPTGAGFQVTCSIQRWWRETRLREMTPLTLRLFDREAATALLDEYFSAQPAFSLFFLPEAITFLNFIVDHSEDIHLTSIARFERALLLARESASRPSPSTDSTTATEIVEFAAPPEALLAALLDNRPLPEPSEERFLALISPALPYLWTPLPEKGIQSLDIRS
jgi:hypothetical protein